MGTTLMRWKPDYEAASMLYQDAGAFHPPPPPPSVAVCFSTFLPRESSEISLKKKPTTGCRALERTCCYTILKPSVVHASATSQHRA